MTWHEGIESHFCVDALFVMISKGLESLGGNIYCYLFATCKRCFCEAPIQKKREIALAMKMFTNDAGSQECIVVDVAREESSRAANNFCI